MGKNTLVVDEDKLAMELFWLVREYSPCSDQVIWEQVRELLKKLVVVPDDTRPS